MENSKIVQEKMKKRKDWITGDTFALLIKNTEYKKENGKYLIFIYDDYAKDELSCSYPVFRVKITKDKKLPQTKEELENLEYVITCVKTVEWELMLSTKDKYQEIIDLQDEWGYLYDYKIKIYTTYKSKPAEDLIYLGNFQLTLPKREYFPYPCNIVLYLWDNILERVLQKYHQHNLNESNKYDKEVCKKWHDYDSIGLNVMQTVQKQIEDGTFVYEEDDKPKKRSTLTYVGGDPNHKDYKRGCNNKKNTKKKD